MVHNKNRSQPEKIHVKTNDHPVESILSGVSSAVSSSAPYKATQAGGLIRRRKSIYSLNEGTLAGVYDGVPAATALDGILRCPPAHRFYELADSIRFSGSVRWQQLSEIVRGGDARKLSVSVMDFGISDSSSGKKTRESFDEHAEGMERSHSGYKAHWWYSAPPPVAATFAKHS